jgi:hypothetical protein
LKSGRLHHLLPDIGCSLFLLLDWAELPVSSVSALAFLRRRLPDCLSRSACAVDLQNMDMVNEAAGQSAAGAISIGCSSQKEAPSGAGKPLRANY